MKDLVRNSDVRTSDVRTSDVRYSDDTLGRGLVSARRTDAITRIGFSAPVVAPAAIVAAFPAAPMVAWSSRGLVTVGIGVARELRGSGEGRWDRLVAAARGHELGATFGEVRSAARWLGGAAFAAGAADRAPWLGFGDAWFALPRWTYTHDDTRAELVLAVDALDATLASRWRDELMMLQRAFAEPFVPKPQPPTRAVVRDRPSAWHDDVRAITAAIDRGECTKIVAARTATVELSGPARPADLFAELDVRDPDCVRVIVRPPDSGTLIAATPERLVRLDGQAVACDALAGSRPHDEADAGAAALLASGKDRREHAIVVDAIVSVLRELGADVRAAAVPDVRALRHVLHLHTPITATLPRARHVLELAARLHPTPAVCGTPTRFASEWIAAHEPARGWYAAPVGWFDRDGNGELAVALRCGVLAGSRARLWAGAGIVAGSEPDRELAETELKLRPMLSALGSEQ